ncbi:hypothetical protein RvY_00729-1 [Ramazzottius varieornatus]|uniref:Uncharacterized protein n=1 Tax=Ramazzottius varieornatus TaxID=947166 RepID=A0A1D1UHG4_RAMVA|nr:hypothetical protein RvY_00729-1 [Ramazzottius varieornatus]
MYSQNSRATSSASKTTLSRPTSRQSVDHSTASSTPVRDSVSEKTLALLSKRSRVQFPEPEVTARAMFQNGPRPGSSRTNLPSASHSCNHPSTDDHHTNNRLQPNVPSQNAIHPVHSGASTGLPIVNHLLEPPKEAFSPLQVPIRMSARPGRPPTYLQQRHSGPY